MRMPTSRAASPCRPAWCTAGAADMTCTPASSTCRHFFPITMRKLSCRSRREISDHRQHSVLKIQETAMRLPISGMIVAALIVLVQPAAAQSTPDLKQLIDDIVAANRILYRQGVVDGFGHVSARHPGRPDRFLLSAAKAPGRVGAEDIKEFDLDGNALDQRGRPVRS